MSQLYDFYRTYYKFERCLYNHRVSVGIDLMLEDVFRLIDPVVDYVSLIKSPSRILKFDDSFLNRINSNFFINDEFYNPQAKEIVERLYNRQLYKFIGEIYVTEKLKLDKITVGDFLKCSTSNGNLINYNFAYLKYYLSIILIIILIISIRWGAIKGGRYNNKKD